MKSKKKNILEKKVAEWQMRLYIAGHTPKSIKAIDNLKNYCEQHLAGKYSIEVIDLLKDPQLAEDDQILAIPTLVRKTPAPIKQIIGDLSNEEKVLVALNIIPVRTENTGTAIL